MDAYPKHTDRNYIRTASLALWRSLVTFLLEFPATDTGKRGVSRPPTGIPYRRSTSELLLLQVCIRIHD